MNTKQLWLKEKYPMSYTSALEKSNPDVKDKTIFFDERYYSSKDISTFFQDLQYADNNCWEAIIHYLPKATYGKSLKSFKKQENEYKEWLKTFPVDLL
jgi:hypothetical protein